MAGPGGERGRRARPEDRPARLPRGAGERAPPVRQDHADPGGRGRPLPVLGAGAAHPVRGPGPQQQPGQVGGAMRAAGPDSTLRSTFKARRQTGMERMESSHRVHGGHHRLR